MAVYLGDCGFGYVEFLFLLYDLYFYVYFMRLSGILGFSAREV